MSMIDRAKALPPTPEVLYMAVTDDRYELPVCICDSLVGLGHQLEIEPWKIQKAFFESRSGVVTPRGRGIKYQRINSRTGEIIVGGLKNKLPPS